MQHLDSSFNLWQNDRFGCMLRATAGNTSHIKIFLILCIQFVLCLDCQFMK